MKPQFSISKDQQTAVLAGIRSFSGMMWGPDVPLCRDMLKRGVLFEIKPLSPVITADPPDALEAMNAWISGFTDAEPLFDALESSYVSLFVSNLKGRIIPLFQSCYEYEDAPMIGPPASMMKERLAEHGLAMGDHTHDPPDHLAVELEFLYFLLTKGWIEHHDACATEAVTFASTTMLPWVNALRERLRRREPPGFYAWLISLVVAVLQYIGKSAAISA